MIRAIIRYIKALGLLVTGQIDAARKTLNSNVYVVQAGYDEIVEDKIKTLGQMKDAIAMMIDQQEKKMAKLDTVNKDIAKCQKLQAGAAAKAKSLVAKYGGDSTKVKTDPNFTKYQSDYRDFSSTLAEKQARAEELEEELEDLTNRINNHKNSMMQQKREVEKIKEEKADITAEIITAKQEEQMNNMIAGISQNDHSRRLQEFRDIANQRKAGARLSRELAGLDSQKDEDDYLVYAETSAADTDFENLIGLNGGGAIEDKKTGGKQDG